jgi:hypothetical protein
METFQEWWVRVGCKIDSEVKKDFAEAAWYNATAQSRNYVASSVIYPSRVTFGNGREVFARLADQGEAYLEVEPAAPFGPNVIDREALSKRIESAAVCFFAEQYGDTPLDLEMVIFASNFAACQLTGYKTEEEENDAEKPCKQCGRVKQHKMDCTKYINF